MARKNKPLKLHKMNGTYRPDRHNEAQPTLQASKPKCPSWLPERARTAFKQLRVIFADKMGVLTEADRHALILLCDVWDEWMEARLTIQREGAYYQSETNQGNKIVRPHPANARRADAWRRIRSMLSEFGATPASRSDVTAAPGSMVKNSYEDGKTKSW